MLTVRVLGIVLVRSERGEAEVDVTSFTQDLNLRPLGYEPRCWQSSRGALGLSAWPACA